MSLPHRKEQNLSISLCLKNSPAIRYEVNTDTRQKQRACPKPTPSSLHQPPSIRSTNGRKASPIHLPSVSYVNIWDYVRRSSLSLASPQRASYAILLSR